MHRPPPPSKLSLPEPEYGPYGVDNPEAALPWMVFLVSFLVVGMILIAFMGLNR